MRLLPIFLNANLDQSFKRPIGAFMFQQSPQQVNLIKAIIADMDAEKRPIYHELAAVIANHIKSNKIKRGMKLPPHRVLGWELGLSPVTVQRAYSELERYSLIDVRVGDGSYVLDSKAKNYHQFRNAPVKDIVSSKNNFSENDTETTLSVIDLSRNQSFLPIDNSKWKGLADLSSIADNTLFSLLNYTDEQGLLGHRQAGATWLKKLGEPISADHIFCTNGAQHGLHITLGAMIKLHQSIAIDEYSYPGILALARRMHIRLVPINMDHHGLCPKDLQHKYGKYRFSALFVMPNLQNPTSIEMPEWRRDIIADFCKHQSIFIIEDETQGILCEPCKRSFFSRIPDQTVLIASVSKFLSSGLRVGYLAVPPSKVETYKKVMRESCWMATPLSHEIAKNCIEENYAKERLVSMRAEIVRRKNLVNQILQDASFTTQKVSPHYWISLPRGLTDLQIANKLLKKNIRVSLSRQFSTQSFQKDHFIRASVSAYCQDDELIDAFQEIQKTLHYI